MLDLIIQHGLLGGPRNWSSITRALQPHFGEIMTPWLLNHGPAPRSSEMSLSLLSQDLSSLVSSRTRPFLLLGSSYGGATIMHYLVSHQKGKKEGGEEGLPPLLQGAMIVDVSPCPIRPPSMPDLTKELPALLNLPLQPGYTRKQAMDDLEEVIPSVDQRGFLLSTIDFSSSSPSPTWITDVNAIYNNLQNLNWTLPPEEIFDKTNPLPIKFVFGANSPYYLEKDSNNSVKKVFPGGEVEVIEEAGHWVHVQQREKFIQSLLRFCEKCDK